MAHISSPATQTSYRRQNRSFFNTLLRIDALYRQRDALSKLDASQMKDLGITQAEIDRELSSSIWSRL
ncbi:MAG: DUF1127 domain-containing protein [Pseudomonadota bacterium]